MPIVLKPALNNFLLKGTTGCNRIEKNMIKNIFTTIDKFKKIQSFQFI